MYLAINGSTSLYRGRGSMQLVADSVRGAREGLRDMMFIWAEEPVSPNVVSVSVWNSHSFRSTTIPECKQTT